MELKPFDKQELMGWAGAEAGPNGESPMIGYVNDNVVIIADNFGIGVYIHTETSQRGYMLVREESYQENVRIARALTPEQIQDIDFLELIGFELSNIEDWS